MVIHDCFCRNFLERARTLHANLIGDLKGLGEVWLYQVAYFQAHGFTLDDATVTVSTD